MTCTLHISISNDAAPDCNLKLPRAVPNDGRLGYPVRTCPVPTVRFRSQTSPTAASAVMLRPFDDVGGSFHATPRYAPFHLAMDCRGRYETFRPIRSYDRYRVTAHPARCGVPLEGHV